jgi:hypothetical protein
MDEIELSADGSGLIPSDLDALRQRVGCLIVDSRCNVTLPFGHLFHPHHYFLAPTERDSYSPGQRPGK